jgi:Uma2 family endonuclease
VTPPLPTDSTVAAQEPPPALRNGDQLTPDEFERRYRAMPDIRKAELLDGVVFLPAPLVTNDIAAARFDLVGWLGLYRMATPGVSGSVNASVRLDKTSEPQPDVCLRILAAHGGQATISMDRFLVGAPELVAEVVEDTRVIELKQKIYERAGVREFICWRVRDQEIDWLILRAGKYEPLLLSAEGVYRSEVFPGLWLAPLTLLRGQGAVVVGTARRGSTSPAHADFVCWLREHADVCNP